MIISTAAIVLKTIDFQESSKIVTLLTPEYGKIAVMVRGCRKPKSKFAGFFDTAAVLDVVLYLKPSRSVQNLSEVSYRQKNWTIPRDFTKMAVAMATMEMLDQLVHDNETSADFFTFTERMLSWLNDTDEDVTSLFPYILIRLADINGIGIQYDAGKTTGPFYLNIEEGSVGNYPGLGLSFKLSEYQHDFVKKALIHRNAAVLRNPFDKSELKLLIHHLDVYFNHHVDGLRQRQSDTIFDQIL